MEKPKPRRLVEVLRDKDSEAYKALTTWMWGFDRRDTPAPKLTPEQEKLKDAVIKIWKMP